uniref:Fe2OG dioxygenase domain-containing protein n=1 Tax=Pseudo-nitzschia australis TaxID=44445 RepID=A0A7S4EIH1_9STRA|mmetsp:Transcript_6927/g.14718  ORF Transcript_6927/g.14718 Transcript_6927/m.14718 type:complete len:561 (+) Transcript_6927:266-1948(+)|eukprot:CAMPEP_0168192832 /NCGR_PEP_ID=MMETSP0139_2-20121125/18261_1 /TAXON_ID=44445 /ORGANISM="Pseudo-nitzschia australis, Strain 10249 10 AB" /LENGTH=560 /DNA_ID=CAMNT_0008116103 /DNA_START=248 /DNA_END=1930 /DNA_ORIENTATION=-
MRRAFLIATFLLGNQFDPILGFSNLLPKASTSTTRVTKTSLSVLEAPLSKIDTSSSDEDEDDVKVILSILEKRIQEGSGSLSSTEIDEFSISSGRLLAELKSQDDVVVDEEAEDEAAGWSAAAKQTPSVETDAPVSLDFLKSLMENPEEPAVTDNIDIVDVAASAAVASETLPEYTELHSAAVQMDAAKVTSLIEAGLEMDEATTEAAFWTIIKAVDQAESEDKPLSGDLPQMLHHIFDADLRHLLTREQQTLNVTCMQPRDDGIEGKARAMNYIFDDSSHKDLPLSEGRRCEGGTCCDACSRNVFPTFASEQEIDWNLFPEIGSISFNDLGKVSSASIIQFTRLIERVRRTIAHEYGLPLSSILPLQAYSRKYVAGTTQQGGGGGEGDFVTLHTDEATHDGYHYSCVMYLSTAGIDFEGGAFVFNDPAKDAAEAKKTEDEGKNMGLEEQIRRAGRKLRPYLPTRGSAVIFSSGWENMHEVEKITSGIRYAVPCFFTTCPVPEAAYTQMAVGKPKTNEDIADDWLHLLLAHRTELPHEATGRVKELLMKWHTMCTPLNQH